MPASWKPWSCSRCSLGQGQRPPTVQDIGRPPNPHHAGLLKDDSRARGGETWSPGWKRGRALARVPAGSVWQGPQVRSAFPVRAWALGPADLGSNPAPPLRLDQVPGASVSLLLCPSECKQYLARRFGVQGRRHSVCQDLSLVPRA